MILDQRASVWRKDPVGLNYQDTQVYADIECSIVPISDFDSAGVYARESTHIIWVPHWLILQKEDKLQVGRQVDIQGDVQPLIYTINGRQRVDLGMNRLTYYAREQD